MTCKTFFWKAFYTSFQNKQNDSISLYLWVTQKYHFVNSFVKNGLKSSKPMSLILFAYFNKLYEVYDFFCVQKFNSLFRRFRGPNSKDLFKKISSMKFAFWGDELSNKKLILTFVAFFNLSSWILVQTKKYLLNWTFNML